MISHRLYFSGLSGKVGPDVDAVCGTGEALRTPEGNTYTTAAIGTRRPAQGFRYYVCLKSMSLQNDGGLLSDRGRRKKAGRKV